MVLLVTNKGKEQHYAHWKRSDPTSRPSPQITMKTACQRFSTIPGFIPF